MKHIQMLRFFHRVIINKLLDVTGVDLVGEEVSSLIVAKDELQLNEIKSIDKPNCEVAWGEIKSNQGSVILGAFYRPPDSDPSVMDDLNESITHVLDKKKDKMMILSGDFNLAHTNWETYEYITGGDDKQHHEKLLDICLESEWHVIQP